MLSNLKIYKPNILFTLIVIVIIQMADFFYFKFLHNGLKFPDYFIIMYATIFISWKYLIKKPLNLLIGIELKNKKELKKNIIEGLIYGFVVTIFVLLILILTSSIKFNINFIYLKSMSYMIFGYLIFIPISAFYEELNYRGIFFMLSKKNNLRLFISIISSLIFTYVHIYILKDYSIYYPINIFILAMIFSLIRIRKNNIIVSTGFHISWNFFLILFSPLFNENTETYAEMNHITTLVISIVLLYEIYRYIDFNKKVPNILVTI